MDEPVTGRVDAGAAEARKPASAEASPDGSGDGQVAGRQEGVAGTDHPELEAARPAFTTRIRTAPPCQRAACPG